MQQILNYFNNNTLPTEVFIDKYAYGKEMPQDTINRVADMFANKEHHRLANINKKNYDYLSVLGKEYIHNYEYNNDNVNGMILNLFSDFKYIIPGGSVLSTLGTDKLSSLSNCFVIDSPKDSITGIMNTCNEQSQLMKYRGGVGFDISSLRPNHSIVNNSAKTSTGAVSFMDLFSNVTNTIAQAGRRGALMLTMSINHPDAEEFILKKQDLTKVTGANCSIKLSNEFMDCVKNNKDFIQTYPLDLDITGITHFDNNYNELVKFGNGYIKRVNALDLWNKIIHCSWNTAEPGIIFEDIHFDFSPDSVYTEYKPISTNPCGEIAMEPYDSCRLIHHNYTSYVINAYTKNASFDYDRFARNCYFGMILGDILIDLEIDAINKILKKLQSDTKNNNIFEKILWERIKDTALASRRTGIGFTGLGDTFAMLGMKYGSPESMNFVKAISKIKEEFELKSSIDLSILYGPFKGWDSNLEYPNDIGANSFYKNLKTNFPDDVARMNIFGRRNVSWSTAAPTGTISILAQTTSGIEPLFLPYYQRKKKILNSTDEAEFIDKMGEKFAIFNIIHQPFIDWACKTHKELTPGILRIMSLPELDKLFAESPWFGSCANDLNYKERVKIQSIVQEFTTHSISSTINLSNDTKDSVIDNIFRDSFELNLKGITVYRDGCRDGILTSINTQNKTNGFVETIAPKRPKELPANLHIVSIKGTKFAILVGLYESKPYEVFAFELTDTNNIEECKGKIVKEKKRTYNFVSDKTNIQNLELSYDDNIEKKAFTLYTSMSLRHGVSIKYIVKTLNKVDENITSFAKALTRVLNKYVPKEILDELCPECSGKLIRENGCVHCSQCSYSKC